MDLDQLRNIPWHFSTCAKINSISERIGLGENQRQNMVFILNSRNQPHSGLLVTWSCRPTVLCGKPTMLKYNLTESSELGQKGL